MWAIFLWVLRLDLLRLFIQGKKEFPKDYKIFQKNWSLDKCRKIVSLMISHWGLVLILANVLIFCLECDKCHVLEISHRILVTSSTNSHISYAYKYPIPYHVFFISIPIVSLTINPSHLLSSITSWVFYLNLLFLQGLFNLG